jgi:hypothetical protein
LAERWAWGDDSISRAALGDAARRYRDTAACAAAAAAWPVGANLYVASAAADYDAAAYADAAADAADAAARTAGLESLADMIRAAVPEVPL